MAQTTERVYPKDKIFNYVFQRSLFAYEVAALQVHGDALEIGSGEGYGIDFIAPRVKSLTAIDKFPIAIDNAAFPNVRFQQMNLPPITFPDNTFDCALSFQVIEHIEDDHAYCSEIARVLKPGASFIVTTPNTLQSLSRNPWHVREYTKETLKELLSTYFSSVECKGVFGNEKVQAYYAENKKSVERITKWDIFNLQYRLPRWMLQAPYDFFNELNRKRLLKSNTELTLSITSKDFYLESATDSCQDLFFIATK